MYLSIFSAEKCWNRFVQLGNIIRAIHLTINVENFVSK